VNINVLPINQPEVMIANAAQRFDSNGNLTDETSKELIRQLLYNLVDWTVRITQKQNASSVLVAG
jgi:chromate reductase, NAD(P)H dehydrogenase (quinone)